MQEDQATGPDPSEPGLRTVRGLSPAVAVPRIELLVEREGGRGEQRLLVLDGDEFRLGSHASNDLVLADNHVSRFHCRIHRGESGWAVVDEGSTNGTLVNGIRVRDADLPQPVSRIQLGMSCVLVRPLKPANVAEIPTTSSFGDLWGESVAMRRLFGLLARVAESDATVLIEGESGTGKELVARELHRRSARADHPFIVIDCGAISPALIESELFGHARGAYTGAAQSRSGAFEAANNGTVLLDEIGELPLDMQPKLLRALEAREIRRVGESQPRRIDVRVLAATNRQLEREVNRRQFREDLYFRLSVIKVRVPPLRQRLDDLPLLVHVLLQSMNAEDAGHLFTAEVLEEWQRHDWPGNVRELRNHVERAVLLETPALDRMSTASLVPGIGGGAQDQDQSPAGVDLNVPFKVAKDAIVADFERAYLTALLEWADGNVSRAARRAKMDRMYLHRLVQRHGVRGQSR